MSRDELMPQAGRDPVRAQRHRTLTRNTFRVRGDVVEIFPAESSKSAHPRGIFRRRDRPHQRDRCRQRRHCDACSSMSPSTPRTHYAAPREAIDRAIGSIEHDLRRARPGIQGEGRADRGAAHRPAHAATISRCSARSATARASKTIPAYFDGRQPGDAPYTLLDYFPEGLSSSSSMKATSPCRRCARCTTATARARRALVDYGFRLPSAFDNRPAAL